MLATMSSRSSPISSATSAERLPRTSRRRTQDRDRKGGGGSRRGVFLNALPWCGVGLLLLAIGLTAAWWVATHGWTLWYGDAEAHLNIARRIVDSRTPDREQIGTIWLPLPHVAMLPLVIRDEWWRSGLAGTAVGVASFVLAGLMLFGAACRSLSSTAAGVTAAFLYALNPNVLYLQATPMTEPLVFAGLAGLLYTSIVAGQTRSWTAIISAGVFSNIASLSRYEGWFVIPFAAVYLLWRAGFARAAAFSAIAALGPLAWLAHNLWYFADAFYFYRGPGSAKAIYQRALDAKMDRYPGDHELGKAWLYFRSAAQLCAGWGLVATGMTGAVAAMIRRAWWPLAFLLLPIVFYVASMYSSGTPIFVPHLWPQSYYNTRYGLAALPLLVFSGAALVSIAPARLRAVAAAAVIGIAILPWLLGREGDRVITWKESQVNSETRRAWTREAARFFRQNYRSGDGVLAGFGDLTGIFREAGIPLRNVLHEGNGPAWYGAIKRPDLFMHERWAVANAGDPVATAMQKLGAERVKIMTFKDAAVEIYRRNGNPIHEDARGKERLPADVGQ
jgi:hypothetical protein